VCAGERRARALSTSRRSRRSAASSRQARMLAIRSASYACTRTASLSLSVSEARGGRAGGAERGCASWCAALCAEHKLCVKTRKELAQQTQRGEDVPIITCCFLSSLFLPLSSPPWRGRTWPGTLHASWSCRCVTGSGKNIWTGNIYFLMACPL